MLDSEINQSILWINQSPVRQEQRLIQPSSNSWASPIILARKKDNMCGYLNNVKESNMLPLPRIDHLLDQLGSEKFFTTLDLAAGYWQIWVVDNLVERKRIYYSYWTLQALCDALWANECSRYFTKIAAESGEWTKDQGPNLLST